MCHGGIFYSVKGISCLQQENTLNSCVIISSLDGNQIFHDVWSQQFGLRTTTTRDAVEKCLLNLILKDKRHQIMTTLSRAPRQNVVPTAEKIDSSQQGLEFLFSPLLEELLNPDYGQAKDNNNDQAPNASFQEAKFINPFCTREQETGESSSRNIDNTDVHSFQPQSHDYRWTRNHPLDQVHGNLTHAVQTRDESFATDPECDELHQFATKPKSLGNLSTKPFGKMIIKLKGLWKNKKDEDQTVITTKYDCSLRLCSGRGYPKDYGFELTAFLDADHAGCLDTRKSTSGGIQFLGDKLVVRLGINPMIQPEPEDLPKDNPKLEIAVLRNVASRMNKMTGYGNASGSQTHLPTRDLQNPKTDYVDHGFFDNRSLTHNKPSRGSQNLNLELIYDCDIANNVETLFGAKFTSQSDIDVFSMRIKEGKYADILSTMSTIDIDAAVDAIETIRKKLQADVSNSSPLVSPSTTINVPRELNSIDVAATFRVSLSTVGDLHKLINDIEADKHDKLLSGMTNDDHMETLDALGSICNSIKKGDLTIDNNPSVMASLNVPNTNDNLAGTSAKKQPNVIFNFRPLVVDPVYDGVNILIPRKVIEKLFKEDSISLIRKPIMLDSYTSSTCKDSWGRSSFARCLIEVNSEADLIDVVSIGIPSLTGDDFTKETIHEHCPKKVVSPLVVTTSNVVAPTIENSNDGFQTVGKKKKRKGKSTSTNGGQFAGPSIKHTVRYEPKAAPSAPKKGTTNVSNPSTSSSMLKTAKTISKKDNFATSNSFSALNDDEEVENVYDESDNLFKTGRSSSFTAAAG
ncbi:hypothetical protein Tco_1200315 [Tanacetum coccineum]